MVAFLALMVAFRVSLVYISYESTNHLGHLLPESTNCSIPTSAQRGHLTPGIFSSITRSITTISATFSLTNVVAGVAVKHILCNRVKIFVKILVEGFVVGVELKG